VSFFDDGMSRFDVELGGSVLLNLRNNFFGLDLAGFSVNLLFLLLDVVSFFDDSGVLLHLRNSVVDLLSLGDVLEGFFNVLQNCIVLMRDLDNGYLGFLNSSLNSGLDRLLHVNLHGPLLLSNLVLAGQPTRALGFPCHSLDHLQLT